MNNWTEQEKWVWEQIKSGGVADFNELPEWKAGGELDPKKIKDKTEPWPEFRKISKKFLTDILFGKDEKGGKYIDSAPVQGIRIYGAWFHEPVDISGGVLERNLFLKQSRFDEDVKALYIIAKGYISLDGSSFLGEFYLSFADIRVNFFINNCGFKGTVNFIGMKAGGQVAMKGSEFTQKLEMDEMTVGGDLFMDEGAVFDGEVMLPGADIGGQVSMKGAKFSKELAMDGMKVGGSLFMDKGAVFDGEVRLHGSDIGGPVSMKGAKFSKELAMDGMKVGGDLFMDDGAVFDGEVRLLGADIGGQVAMKGSMFKQELTMDRMKVAGDLLMDERAVFDREVRLRGASIDGVVSMDGAFLNNVNSVELLVLPDDLEFPESLKRKIFYEQSTKLLFFIGVMHVKDMHDLLKLSEDVLFGGGIIRLFQMSQNSLIMENATSSDVLFRGITLNGGANLYCLHARNNFFIGPITCETGKDAQKIMINLDSAVIGKKLKLMTDSTTDKNFWEKATINLSHAKAGIFAASDNSWPDSPGRIDLTGLIYDRLEDLDKEENKTTNIGEIPWLGKMLKSQSPFTPQPYEQLAKVLMAEGCRDKAEEILYEKKEYEISHSARISRRTLMWLEKIFIGFGYRNSRALGWAGFMILLGLAVVANSHEVKGKGFVWMLGYSIDMLLPIVTLGKEFTEFQWKNQWVQLYFFAHQLIGWMLALFITAGLSGMTKK